MTDYRDLTPFHQSRVDKNILEVVEPGHQINQHNGFEWDEPQYTLNAVHSGDYCAECLNVYYNCLCSHDN